MHTPDSDIAENLEEWYSYKKRKAVSWRRISANIRTYSFFIRQLVKITFLEDFKRSHLGLLWLFILPIIAAVAWIALNGAGVIEPGDIGVPYPAFVLLSTAIWGFFIEIYRNTSSIFLSGGRMKLMASFPYEAFVAEKIIVHLVRFVIPFLINIIVLLLFGVRFTWTILLFPFSLIPLFLLGLSIGLIVSLFRVLLEDLAILIDQGMGFLMFFTPVVYSPDLKLGFLSKVIQVNPLTYLVGFSRDLLIKGTFYEPWTWAACSLFSMLAFLIAVYIFAVAEPRVIERLIK